MSIDTILLAVGPGDRNRTDILVEETINVAQPTGASVVLLHVFSKEEYEEGYDTVGFDSDDVTPDEVADRHSTIRNLAVALDEAGVEYQIRGAVGTKGEEIVAAATEIDADRVFVGGRGRSPTGKAIFGSIAQEVLLSSPCPVTFVRGDVEDLE